MKRLVFGFDLDGVVDRYPESVRWLTNHLLHSGHEVHIISGRRLARDWEGTLQLLKRLKVRYTQLHLYPGDYEWSGVALDSDTSQDIGSWKAGICEDLGAIIYFDDQLHTYRADFGDTGTVHV